MKSFKSHDKSNVTFKFLFTGLTALSLLFVIGVVIFVWYFVRKRREEKSRHSQHIEETFSERLASRSVTGKSSSKIDVGFTSQQTLNDDQEDRERRPTFSRFLKLWNGLRNSKRKSANEESTRSVVFTIPTEDVFPRTHTRQQTFHQDAVTQTSGQFRSHICEVHRMTHDIIEECSDHDLHHLDDETEEDNRKNTKNESGSRKNKQTLVEGDVIAPDRKTSDEKNLQGKEEGKSSSKESDVDSGCGSSCHEIFAAEPHTTHAQLNVSSLVYCHAQKTNTIETEKNINKVSGRSFESKEIKNLSISVPTNAPHETNTDVCDGVVEGPSSNKYESQFQKSGDSFEELIQLAKDGMSTLARKRVDNYGKKNKISDCFQASSVDNSCRTQDKSTSTNDENIHSRIASQRGFDARKVDAGVKRIPSASLCSDDTNSMGKILYRSVEENQSDTSISKFSHYNTTESHSDKIMGTILRCYTEENQPDTPIIVGKTLLEKTPENCTGKSMDKTLHNANIEKQYGETSRTTDNKPDKASSPVTCAVQMPTTVLESDPITANNTSETTAEHLEALRLKDDHTTLSHDKEYKDDPTHEINLQTCNNNEDSLSCTQKAVTFEKHHHNALRIQESLLNSSQIIEKKNRPKSLVLPSASEQNKTDTKMLGLKVPSLETLHLPSQTSDQTNRARSFSATIRRKLSFRERSDDMDKTNNKKLKVFRSFRVNRKKKTKAEETSQSTGCLSDPKQYLSAIDKIFHENTGSAIFSDVPFTIPEISEQ